MLTYNKRKTPFYAWAATFPKFSFYFHQIANSICLRGHVVIVVQSMLLSAGRRTGFLAS